MEENQNINLPTEEENKTKIIRKENYIKSAFKLFLKVYGIRIVYSLFQLFRNKKSNFSFQNILKHIFSMANLRTSLSIALLPFIFNLLNNSFNLFSNLNKNSDLTVFLSGLISAFISINIEEKTKLVNYIVISIVVRVVHSLIILFLKKYNLFQKTGKVWDYFVFLVSAICVWTVYFLNPSYGPISSLIDSYANYANEEERLHALNIRNSTALV